MTSTIRDGEPTLPVIEDTPVAARHIVRAQPGETGAVEIVPGAWWKPAPDERGLIGERGWVSASVERRVRDTSVLQGLVLPNDTGDDGILHRDRFALRTDPEYRLGDEWIELVDEQTGEPLAVVTPETLRVDKTTVNLSGPDAAALLSGFRESKVAPWTPHAPQDVLDWYSHAPRHALDHDFATSGTAGWAVGADNGGTVTIGPPGARMLNPVTGGGTTRGTTAIAWSYDGDPRPIGWEAQMHLTVAQIDAGGGVALQGYRSDDTVEWEFAYNEGRVAVQIGAARVYAAAPPLPVDQQVTFSVVAREEWAVFTLNGAVVGQLRRSGGLDELAQVKVAAGGGADTTDVTLARCSLTVLEPFLRRAAPAPDHRVAGAPTPGGLRGDYVITFDEWSKGGGSAEAYGAQIPAPLAEPYQSRLDPAVAFFGSTWMPPGPPGGYGFAVRWSGSIYLDLETSDVELRVASVNMMARLWVGSVMGPGVVNGWGYDNGGVSSDAVSMRSHLGTPDAGWYPIVLEYAAGTTGTPSVYLQRRVEGGPWTTVPSTELSPYGCWEGDLGGESHRGAIDSVCNTSGLSWRLQPKTLESGEFPGRLEHGARLGRDTDYVLGEAEATEYASDVAAADVVDRVTADAQGLGDNLGREGLTAEMTNPAATERPWLLTRSETLGDITEQSLLRQRLSTLLALYGSVAETIAARPRGKRELVDSFPTDGAAASDDARVFLWEPDDAIRVRLPSVGIDDRTPRAMTSITWPLTPRGRGAPSVGFRQRPRHLRETLRRLQRGVALQRRRYQGQLAYLTGSMGSTSPSVAPDAYSRLGLPIGRVARVEVNVMYVVGTPTLEVCGVATGLVVTQPGVYDVSAFVPAGRGDADARLVSPGAFGGDLQLVATVRL